MIKIFLPSLTKAMNAYIALDPESRQRITKLQGKAITIEFLPFHLKFQCLFNEGSVTLIADDEIMTETTIRGTPMQMLGVVIAKENRQRFFAEDMVIEGNAEFGQQVIELFDHMQIDWEEYLSRFVGDVPAHHAGQFARRIGSWLINTEKNFSQNINEYVHEEMKWLPAREALQDFFTDIDTIRMDVDRIEARIKNLQTCLTDNEDKQ